MSTRRSSRRTFSRVSPRRPLPHRWLLPSHVWAAETKPNSRLSGWASSAWARSPAACWAASWARIPRCWPSATWTPPAARPPSSGSTSSMRPEPTSGACAAYNDFREIIDRKDIDAVCIATPDHWHAIITLAALRAGKDVYCEKPLTHNIHEAIEVMRAVDANQRVLQTGSMQRSIEGVPRGLRAGAQRVHRQGPARRVQLRRPGPCPAICPRSRWSRAWIGTCGWARRRCGPTIRCSARAACTSISRNWREYREFGGGRVTDWGAHHLDIAQWGLGMDDSGPVEVLPPAKAGAKRGAKLVYANGVTVEHKDGFGVDFFGTEGEVQVNRGKFTFKRGNGGDRLLHPDRKGQEELLCRRGAEGREGLPGKTPRSSSTSARTTSPISWSASASRKKPITSEQVGGHSAICCHLMNQAYYHGQKIKWDPAKFAVRRRHRRSRSGSPATTAARGASEQRPTCNRHPFIRVQENALRDSVSI